MSIVARIKSAASGFVNYSAAQDTDKRRPLSNTPVSPKMDISSGSRERMMASAREKEKDSAIMGAILQAEDAYTIHTGIQPRSNTSSTTFNGDADEYWNQWIQVCDVTSRLGFYEIQRLINRREFVDGDIFTLLTHNDRGSPRIQLVESHRCNSKYDKGEREFDGAILDARGRVASWRFWQDRDTHYSGTKSVLKKSDDVVQHYTPYRVNQARGVTKVANILEKISDVDELLDAEMQVAKANANERDVVINETGEVEGDPTKKFFGKKPQTVSNMSEEEARQELAYYREVVGPETLFIKRGDDIKRLESNRPSKEFQGHLRHLLREICAGIGISFDLIWEPSDQGGATCRFQIEKDQRYFEIRGMARTREFQRIREYVIGRAIDLGDLRNAPKDWKRTIWMPPRRPSVDLGRDAKAMVDKFAIGGTSLHRIHGDAGDDWEQVIAEKGENVARAAVLAKELSKKYGVEIKREEILRLDNNEISSKSGAKNLNTKTDEGGDDDE